MQRESELGNYCDSATKRLVAVCRICKDAAEHKKPTYFRGFQSGTCLWQEPEVGVLDTLQSLGL